MQRVYSARDLTEAHFVKGLLDAEDIPSVVQGGPLQAVLGEIPVTPESLPSIWVNEQDVASARLIIDQMKRGGPAKSERQAPWTCPKCGENLEGQFSICWNCGSERPA
jgi:hypothetical protein